MGKLPYKQHIIGVEGTELKVAQAVEHLSRRFADVTSEIVKYQGFANGETKVELKESVRQRYTYLVDDLQHTLCPSRENLVNVLSTASGRTSAPSIKFNNQVFLSMLIKVCAINHGAKGLILDEIPCYGIQRKYPTPSIDVVPEFNPIGDPAAIVKHFEKMKLMLPAQKERIHLVGTQDTMDFTKSMYDYLATHLGKKAVSHEISIYNESNAGFTQVALQHPVQNKHVYVVGDPNGLKNVPGLDVQPSYNDRLMQMFILSNEARKYQAKKRNFVPLCFPYSRQDKPILGAMKERVVREPSSAQFMLDILQHFLGVDYCITMDIHNPAIVTSNIKFINLYIGWMIQHVAEILRQEGKDAFKISGMDEGSLKKVRSVSDDLDLEHLIVLKTRDYSQTGIVNSTFVYGDVEGKDILIHDDMLDTGGTLIKLIEELHKRGARSINIVITHGMFNGQAIPKLKALHDGHFENIYISNTVYRDKETYPDFVKVIDAAKNFTDPIRSIYLNESINYNFGVHKAAK